MAKKFICLSILLVCSVLTNGASLQDKKLSRHKRFVLSSLSRWWYGEPTTSSPVEDLPFRDDLNSNYYPYYNPTSYPVQYLPHEQTPHVEDDLGRLAREIGIRHIRNLPKIEEVMGLLGTSTKDETIQAIREFAATPGGVDMIESFLAPEVPEQEIHQETLRNTGVHSARVLTQTEEQRNQQTANRFITDAEIGQKVLPQSEGFLSTLGHYANFLNPFALSESVDVPLPTEKPVTVRPVVYRYPEGYDPHTKTFTNSKERVELQEEDHKKLKNEQNFGPYVRFSQEIQPLIRTPQQFSHNSIVNAPIPAYIYQNGLGNPYFVDQHRYAAVPYPFNTQQTVPNVPVIDLNNAEYSPEQVEALKKQVPGQFLAVPMPNVHPAVTRFDSNDGSFNIDVRFNNPINVEDVQSSASEVKETVVAPPSTTTTTTETPNVATEAPVSTTTEKKVEEDTKIVTVLPSELSDFVFDDSVPKQLGEKVLENVTNLTVEPLTIDEASKQAN